MNQRLLIHWIESIAIRFWDHDALYYVPVREKLFSQRVGLTRDEQSEVRAYLEEKGLPHHVAVTFADVALPDRYSDVRSRSEIFDFQSSLARGVMLRTPIMSSNMESVTGHEMAIALAREGGIGCVPQMLPLKDRLEILRRVRRADSAFIEHPLTILPNRTLADAKKLMQGFGIWSVIVVDRREKPIGILTSRDWRYETNDRMRVRDLMNGKKLITARLGTSREKARGILQKHRIEKLPLVDSRGRLAGLMTAHGLFYEMRHPQALRDSDGKFLVVGSIGVGRTFEKKHLSEVESQLKEGASALLVDTARAYSVNVHEALTVLKKKFPKVPLIVGNVCTPEGAKFLFDLGADAVKVNQGRGYACRTSQVGVGLPQLSAIAQCAAIAKKYGGKVIADGGMKGVGDMVKAIAAGAHTLMTGYLLVGTSESAATLYMNEAGLPVKNYEGSASFHAQTKRMVRGTIDHVRRPEGVTKEVPVVGTVADRMRDIMDGFRSAMSYCGVRSLEALRREGRFVIQTHAGWFEGVK